MSNGVAAVVASYRLTRNIALEITVNTSLEVLEAEALKLTPADRSHLLERLVASLDFDPEVEAAWEREADSREAVPLLIRLLELRPADPTGHAMLAVLQYRNGDCTAAVPHFDKAG